MCSQNWLLASVTAWLMKHTSVWLIKHTSVWLIRHTSVWLIKHMSVWLNKHTSVWLIKHTSVWLIKQSSVWLIKQSVWLMRPTSVWLMKHSSIWLMKHTSVFVLILSLIKSIWEIHAIHLPIFFRVSSLAPGQSYDCPSACEVTLNNMGKVGWYQTTAKPKQSQIICIFLGIYYNNVTYRWLSVQDCSISSASALEILQSCTLSHRYMLYRTWTKFQYSWEFSMQPNLKCNGDNIFMFSENSLEGYVYSNRFLKKYLYMNWLR